MNNITISASKTYDVITDTGLLCRAGSFIRRALGENTKKLCIVTDDQVDPLYTAPLWKALETEGFRLAKFVFPHGEASKTLDTVSDLLEFLADSQLTRSDGLIALGGGIAGDVTGFAAASYLRGIAFVQVPTTLLAAVDSSVGGKTGVNLKAGKIWPEPFWQPSMVLFDLDTIKTLPYELFLDGVAESIKAGAIADKELFSYIQETERLSDLSAIAHLSQRAIEIKRQVVEEDERDTGVRQLLNFGHTIGHAIEKCSGFSITHGHAVAIGMVIVSRAAEHIGWCRENAQLPLKKA